MTLHAAGPLPALIMMTDETRMPDPLPAIAALPPGAAVIFRHYGAPDRPALAARVVSFARAHGVRVLIAGDARLAVAAGADGLHLPDALVRRGPGPWRLWRNPGGVVTAAAHSAIGLFRARRAGADAVLLAPVFTTASHPDRRPLGVTRFAALCRRSPLPVYALGGVTWARWRRIEPTGAVGFAGIGVFQD